MFRGEFITTRGEGTISHHKMSSKDQFSIWLCCVSACGTLIELDIFIDIYFKNYMVNCKKKVSDTPVPSRDVI
jgi:hypothetical protein